eukprot:5004111-Alexandrium_andersonii.AAC.1
MSRPFPAPFALSWPLLGLLGTPTNPAKFDGFSGDLPGPVQHHARALPWPSQTRSGGGQSA